MITLITGLPGAGKTLYAIAWLKAMAEKDGRQVYFSGIADLKVPGWIELPDVEKWMDVPKGSIVLIDEIQRVMRPRMHGTTVPPFVAALETHRHLGIDLVFVTQDPMLLDPNVRRLGGQHFHVVRKFGTKFATVHEWAAIKENATKSRKDSITHQFRYPTDVFALYKSAEVHTHKARIPFKVWLLICIPLIVIVIAFVVYKRLDPHRNDLASGAVASSGGVTGGAGGVARGGMTRVEYVASFSPRVEGLAYTAPAYDQVTAPVVAPYPAACVKSATRCQCYTQQGTRLATTDTLCKTIAEGGFFVAWTQPVAQAVPLQTSQALSDRPVGVGSAAGSIGPIGLMAEPPRAPPADEGRAAGQRGQALPRLR